MTEQRREPRPAVAVTCDCEGSFAATTTNISRRGLRLSGPMNAKVGDRFVIHVDVDARRPHARERLHQLEEGGLGLFELISPHLPPRRLAVDGEGAAVRSVAAGAESLEELVLLGPHCLVDARRLWLGVANVLAVASVVIGAHRAAASSRRR